MQPNKKANFKKYFMFFHETNNNVRKASLWERRNCSWLWEMLFIYIII